MPVRLYTILCNKTGKYVVYEDGYNSLSPAKAFEDGYAQIN
jgi:hypothetical protein